MKRKTFLSFLMSLLLSASADFVFALNKSAESEGINAEAVWNAGYTGAGVGVGIVSLEHARVDHEAFFDKDASGNPTGSSHAHWYDPTDDPTISYEPYWHDTTMAGIVGSRGGKLYPDYLGMAPDAEIYTVKVTRNNPDNPSSRIVPSTDAAWLEWFEDGFSYLLSNNARIAVTGFQLFDEANGDSQFSLCYDYYSYNHDMIFVNAAGNDETEITVFGDSYNGITAGGLIVTEPDVYLRIGTASNPGETVDDRRKPDICTPAHNLWVPTSSSTTAWKSEGTTRGETSWAGPHAAGAAALLLSFAKTTAGEAYDGRSEVIKAVIINSAFPNILDEYGNATTGQVWNAYRGYGRIDAKRALEILQQSRVSPSTYISQVKGWAFQAITLNYQADTFRIYGRKNHRLVLSMTWHRAVKKGMFGYEEDSLINLDMTVRSPSGQILYREAGLPNNLRKADLLLGQDGYYEIEIKNTTTVKNRNYAMAYELLEPLEGDFDTNYVVNISDLSKLSFFWLATSCDQSSECLPLDLYPDGTINIDDLELFTLNWLAIDRRYSGMQ